VSQSDNLFGVEAEGLRQTGEVVDAGGNVLEGLRPTTLPGFAVVCGPAVLEVPNGKAVLHEVLGQRDTKIRRVFVPPVTTMNDDDGSSRRH
jgi:hypothetical protein